MTQQNVDRDSQANTPINGIAGRVVRSWLYIMPSGPTDLTFGHPAGRRAVKRLGDASMNASYTIPVGTTIRPVDRGIISVVRNPARHPLIKENDELGTLAHVRAVLAHPLLASANRRGCRLNTKREQEET